MYAIVSLFFTFGISCKLSSQSDAKQHYFCFCPQEPIATVYHYIFPAPNWIPSMWLKHRIWKRQVCNLKSLLYLHYSYYYYYYYYYYYCYYLGWFNTDKVRKFTGQCQTPSRGKLEKLTQMMGWLEELAEDGYMMKKNLLKDNDEDNADVQQWNLNRKL